MAFWDKLSSRGNVEDRRGMGPTAIGGGVGVVGLILYLVINYAATGRIDTTAILSGLQHAQVSTQSIDTKQFNGADSYEVFVSTVLGSTNDMWQKTFAANNKTYTPPALVLFRGSTHSACGGAVSQVGPHYCPQDQTIYLDETFFNELTKRFGAKGGDVAQAYVIAHEVGHHAQNQLGIMDQVSTQTNSSNANQESIKLELQADCFAGLWAYSIKDKGVFEPNEITEALDAAAAVGDDNIQKKTEGSVSPETWTHGSSQERVDWFTRGYTSGSLAKCDTFH